MGRGHRPESCGEPRDGTRGIGGAEMGGAVVWKLMLALMARVDLGRDLRER